MYWRQKDFTQIFLNFHEKKGQAVLRVSVPHKWFVIVADPAITAGILGEAQQQQQQQPAMDSSQQQEQEQHLCGQNRHQPQQQQEQQQHLWGAVLAESAGSSSRRQQRVLPSIMAAIRMVDETLFILLISAKACLPAFRSYSKQQQHNKQLIKQQHMIVKAY